MAKFATLIDDFQDGVIDTSKWVTSGTVAETGGRAKLTPTTSFAFWQTAPATTYDLTNSQVVMQVPVITANGSTGTLQSGVVIEIDTNNRLGIRKVSSDLICTKTVGGTETQLSFAAYNSVNHQFWRIRADSSNVYWETSSNGTGYFIQHTESIAGLGFSISSTLTLFFYSGYSGAEAFPGTFQIEAINPGLPIASHGTSTSTGSLALLITAPDMITGSALSTSTGSLALTIVPATTLHITASGTSTSTGHVALSLVVPRLITASGSSTSTGSLALSIAVPDLLTGSGLSASTGSLAFNILAAGILTLRGSAQSTSTGSATLITITPPIAPTSQWLFEPPVAYDLPPTLPNPRPKYINAYARWKGGQRRGRTVLKNGSVYTTVDSPTVDQIAAADEAYLGGHIYTVDGVVANNLVAAGYSVTAIPADITRPILTIIAPRPNATVDALVRVLVTTSEPSSLVGTLTTGQTVFPIAFPTPSITINTSLLPDAVYRLAITATDAAFNSITEYVDFQVIHPITGLFPAILLYPSTILYPLPAP